MRSAFLSAGAVLLTAFPALAGPVGSGLSHTEEVARRAAQRTIAITQPDQTCAHQTAERVRAHDGVTWAKVRPGKVLIAFRSDEQAARGAAEVRAVIPENCRAA